MCSTRTVVQTRRNHHHLARDRGRFKHGSQLRVKLFYERARAQQEPLTPPPPTAPAASSRSGSSLNTDAHPPRKNEKKEKQINDLAWPDIKTAIPEWAWKWKHAKSNISVTRSRKNNNFIVWCEKGKLRQAMRTKAQKWATEKRADGCGWWWARQPSECRSERARRKQHKKADGTLARSL